MSQPGKAQAPDEIFITELLLFQTIYLNKEMLHRE